MVNKLFIYDNLLYQAVNRKYNMQPSKHAVIKGYLTIGTDKPQAIPVTHDMVVLSGVIVEIPAKKWTKLDRRHSDFDRRLVDTLAGEKVYIYTQKKGLRQEIDKEEDDDTPTRADGAGFRLPEKATV